MTAKNFALIASVIRDMELPPEDAAVRYVVALNFADNLEANFERFDRARFLVACSPIGQNYNCMPPHMSDLQLAIALGRAKARHLLSQ